MSEELILSPSDPAWHERRREVYTASDMGVLFGLPGFGDATARASLFCAAGVDNGTCAYGQPADGQWGTGGIGTERGPGFFNVDFSVGKKFNVTEKNYLDFRVELFNAFNHVSWAPPGVRNINSPATFGQITSQVQNPRNIQFGLKYHF